MTSSKSLITINYNDSILYTIQNSYNNKQIN